MKKTAVRGRGICAVRAFCGLGGRRFFIQIRTSALFGGKNSGFFEIYGVSAASRKKGREVEPVQTFIGQGGRDQFFAILCGRPLWTTIYEY